MIAFLTIIVLLGVLFLYGWFIEPRQITIRSQDVPVDSHRLSASVRVLFISDIHFNALVSEKETLRRLRHLHRLLANTSPHLILLGGDYLDHDPAYLPRLGGFLDELAKYGVPVLGVLGNHDYFSFKGDGETARRAIKKEGKDRLVLLCNEAREITAGGQRLLCIGLEDLECEGEYGQLPWQVPLEEYARQAARIGWYREFDSLQPNLPRILITHNPDGALLPGEPRPDLILAGHTHGGQMLWLRWLWRWVRPHLPRGSFGFWSGFRMVVDSPLVVVQGWGGSRVPYRFLVPAEVALITLIPSQVPSESGNGEMKERS